MPIDLTQYGINASFTIHRLTCGWLIKAKEAKSTNLDERQLLSKLVPNASQQQLSKLLETILVCPTPLEQDRYPLSLVVSDNCPPRCLYEKYKMFNTKVIFGTCHGKSYLLFPNEHILFTLGLSTLDIIEIVKKLKIKVILDVNGKVSSPMDILLSNILY